MNKPKVVFMGSGPVASKSLELLTNNFDIEAVITKPKPIHHRGNFPVLELAESLELPTFTVNNKKELDYLIDSKTFKSELGIIIDFGIIVSRVVIDSFPLGIVNSHFSLLPQWRGADPITFSILSGQPKTGVSLMTIDEGMDTGKLITYKSISILASETTPSLTDRLIQLSDQLLTEYLPRYLNGEIKPKNQPHPDRATYSRKLTKDDGIIDWSKPADQIEREIRAFIEWPKSRTIMFDKEVIVTQSSICEKQGKPGTFEIDSKKIIAFCGDKSLYIERLKPSGKSEMPADAFIAGYIRN